MASASALGVLAQGVAAGAVVADAAVADATVAVLPTFTNVARHVGLGDVPAKRLVFADVDGDGFADLVVDAARLFLSQPAQDGGRRFIEAPASGLDRGRAGMLRRPDLVLFADLDDDGDLDAVSARSVALELPLVAPETEAPILDGDDCPVPAHPDHGERTEVLLNDGTGRFTVVPGSGLERPETTSALAVFDWDRDGKLDLYVGNWYREYGLSLRAYSDRLYRGLGLGRFADVTVAAGVATDDEVGTRRAAKPTYGVTHADVDGDGGMDILVATYGRQWNVLWRLGEDGRYVDVASAWHFDGDAARDGQYWAIDRAPEEEFRANGNTFDLAVSDFDNDGDLDVLTGEICHYWGGPSSDRSELLINDRGRGFERVRDRGLDRPHPEPWRWNEGDIHVGWIDFDNDGLDDALIASGDYPDPQMLRLWRQTADHRFVEVTALVGLDWEGCGAISIADFDRDGDLDIAVGRSLFRQPSERRAALGAGPGLWRNDTPSGHHWLQVVLRGDGANRGGVGARVTLRTADTTQTRELITGRGHMGHEDELVLHFGLGVHQQVDQLTVRWPDRQLTTERFHDLAVDRRIVIEQGKGIR